MAAEQLRVQIDRVTSLHSHLADGSCIGATVFSWDSGRHYAALDADAEAAGKEFLRAHGIEPLTFMIGNVLTVQARCDGSLWLDTWRAIARDEEGSLLCEYCPACVRQERVTVPLIAPVPTALVDGAYVDDVVRGVAVEAVD